jgi:hypothetical protein
MLLQLRTAAEPRRAVRRGRKAAHDGLNENPSRGAASFTPKRIAHHKRYLLVPTSRCIHPETTACAGARAGGPGKAPTNEFGCPVQP